MSAFAVLAFRIWLSYHPDAMMAPGPVFMPHSAALSRYVCWRWDRGKDGGPDQILCSTVEAV